MESIKNQFIAAITNTAPQQPEILVYFKGRTEPIAYTMAIIDLLKTDPATETIISAETGEIIFYRQ